MEYQMALHEWADGDAKLDLRLSRLLRNTALRLTLMQNAIDRQCSNMSFVLNHVELPQQWQDKFEREYVADWQYAGVTAGVPDKTDKPT